MNDEGGRVPVDPATYRALLESTRAIPWKIDWASMRFAYIGPQIGPLLGWSPESWTTVQDWADRIHPGDRERVVSFCVAQSQAGVDHEADYRALTADGDYVWIRDVVHVVRSADASVESLVGFMFDISQRKHAEDQVQRLQAELEALSYTDALTGLANRRRFDAAMADAWEQASQSGQPLSLVMFDIDDFKAYNDAHGHLQGDACLQQVAGLLAGAITAPEALLARFGGEEFSLVLPRTDATGAHAIAEACRACLAGAGIAHPRSRTGGVLTMSAGIGTTVPAAGATWQGFLDAVDRRLYLAKDAGRNRIVSGA